MKRKLAMFMTAVLCVSSVPQTSFLGVSAEEVFTEAETLEAEEPVSLAETAAPEADELETTAPETEAQETAVLETAVIETAVLETEIPETTVETTAPGTEMPETTAPETAAPETEMPETTVPETTVPETTAPETEVPETTAPETEVPETAAPETEVPETVKPKETETEIETAAETETAAAETENESAESEVPVLSGISITGPVGGKFLDTDNLKYAEAEKGIHFDLWAEYTDGTREKIDIKGSYENQYLEDPYGNQFWRDLTRKDTGETCSITDSLEKGTYTLNVYSSQYDDLKGSVDFEVYSVVDEAQEWLPGENITFTEDQKLLKYTVPEGMEGWYLIAQRGLYADISGSIYDCISMGYNTDVPYMHDQYNRFGLRYFPAGAVCYFDFYKGAYDTGAVYFHPISNVWDIEEALTCEAGTMTVVRFTPDQSGWYYISNYDEIEESTTTGDLWSENGTPESRSGGQWKLEAGKTYIYTYRNYGGENTASARMVPDITDLSVDFQNERTLVEGDQLEYGDLLVEATYQFLDGSSETYGVWNGADEYGNELTFTIVDQNDSSKYYGLWEELPAGEYQVSVSYETDGGHTISANTPVFKVYSRAEMAGTEVKENVTAYFTKQSEDETVRFYFTPQSTGRYDLICSVNADINVTDTEGNGLDVWDSSETNKWISLTAGETVYFQATSYGKGFHITIQPSEEVTSATVRPKLEGAFYAQISGISAGDFAVDLTYSDGGNNTIEGTLNDDLGNGFQYEVTTPDGSVESIYWGHYVPPVPGQYTVTATLNGRTLKAEYSFTAEEVDLSKLPLAEENTKLNVASGRTLFRFVPKQSGTYRVTDGNFLYGDFYQKTENGWEKADKTKLVKGQEYALYLKQEYGNNESVTIVYQEGKQDSTGNTLTLGQKYNLTMKESETRELFFTPEETGNYLFESTDTTDEDPCFWLYQGDTLISENSYSVRVSLEKGVTYRLTVGFYSEDEEELNFSVRVVKKEAAVLEDLELHNGLGSRYAYNEVYGIGGEEELGELLEELWLGKWYDSGDWDSERLSLIDMTKQPDGSYTFKDDDGAEYVLTMTATTVVNGTTTYEVVVSSGSLSAKAYIKVTAEGSVPTAVEGQASQISIAGGAEPGRKFWKFVPSETGYYDAAVTGSLGTPSQTIVLDNTASDYLEYKGVQGGWLMEQGTEYYIGVDYHTTQVGTAAVTVTRSDEKELADMELVSGPVYTLALDQAATPDGEGAVLNLIYTDGTKRQVTYTGYDNKYGIWVNSCRVSDKKYRIAYILEDGDARYCAVTYVPYTSWESLPLLQEGVFEEKFAEKNAALGIHSYETKGFRFTPSKDGGYNFLTDRENLDDLEHFNVLDSSRKQAPYDRDTGAWLLSKGETYYVVIAARGTLKIGFQEAGTHVHQGVWQTVTEPTCGQAGLAVETCSICGEKLAENILNATGEHTYTKTVVDKAATCTAAGSQHRECGVCGQQEAATVIPAKGHTFVTKVDKAATCGAAGSQHKECTVCGYKEAATAIPVTNAHKYVTKIDKAATCGAAGSKHEECSVCGAKKAAVSIPATEAHKFGAYKTTVSATVMKTGTKERTCSVCGKKETLVIPKLKATIKVAKKSVTVNVDSSVQAPKVTFRTGDGIKSWKVKDSKIASVDKKGKITGKKAGKTTVTVTLKSGKTAKITVVVKKIATKKVTVDQKKVTLKKGKTCQLEVTVTPKNSQDKVTYKSSDSKIVSVSANGKITAKKKGKATITITSGKKKTTCKVTVK